MTHLPDEVGRAADGELQRVLKLQGLAVASVNLDWNTNECTVELYVCDRQGHKLADAAGAPVTTFVTWPIHAPVESVVGRHATRSPDA